MVHDASGAQPAPAAQLKRQPATERYSCPTDSLTIRIPIGAALQQPIRQLYQEEYHLMQRHPYFDLWLHDDDELTATLGSPIMKRVTIHEWPLSCVQRLQCAAGPSYIYKVQAPPTVEPTFYQHAQSPLVVAARMLHHDHAPAALLLEDVQAQRISELSLAESTLLTLVDDIILQIAQIAGDLPTLSDIRTSAHWLAHGLAITEDLRALVASGSFQQVHTAMIDQVSAHVHSSIVLTVINGPTGYVHTDLRDKNVLVLADGYRVLDWQRPIWGPVALDRATMLESVGVDPARHVLVGVLQLRTLLLIGWYAQTARHWFPDGATWYDSEIVKLVKQLETQQSAAHIQTG